MERLKNYAKNVYAKYKSMDSDDRATARVVGIFAVLVLFAMVIHACSG